LSEILRPAFPLCLPDGRLLTLANGRGACSARPRTELLPAALLGLYKSAQVKPR
jgi:hypothetical protein